MRGNTWDRQIAQKKILYHGPVPPDTTGDLLDRARAGDREALNLLFERHVPELKRWASGRLPRWARDISDTSDLVQETIVTTLKHLDAFEHRGDGALQAYLRQAVINRIRNELRRLATRGQATTLESGMPDEGTSPLEATIARETLDRYDEALQRLRPEEREAIVARVELGLSYTEIAELLHKPSANAARMTVVRSIMRLAEEMGHAL
jgi:RNA polymerase sigma-70 factor, ECF subfamily